MKKYCITDPTFYTQDPATFTQKLLHVNALHHPDLICLRDKTTSQYELLAEAFAALRPSLKTARLYLHTHVELASKLGCDGVHLPSSMIESIPYAKQLNLEVILSAHTLEEAFRAQNLGADAITMSPVFFTPNKGEPLGLEKLKEINDKITINCFALGGIINDEQVRACEAVGVYGFASIRYFVE